MDDRLSILLTNDDGYGEPGIVAMGEELSQIADVTVVAPATDQSACGRAISNEVTVDERDDGYAITGTPADCVVAGLSEFAPDPDLVVAGCNEGANLGAYVLGRSGTISAAVEAAFFDVPAIATSMYVPVGDLAFEDVETTPADFAEATRATRYLVEHALSAGVFEDASYLNVNVPMNGGREPPMVVTRPSKRYEMDATRNGSTITVEDGVWETMDPETIPDPPGTDRRAVVEGQVSVSPLVAPHTTGSQAQLEALAEAYPRSRGRKSASERTNE
ncbi:5'/3'-nucleotidase SurE [Halovivax gelatinilyticus]|uniref:5'/3'-nucleotidase SurE n=1 Tax=Halovivax gelatinilyticus TaxID=2961597 RepID=UPI0020CA6A39|nr:5'/3'-nucleotidase SurE [Halovivax gelatinilyticus]